MKQKDIRLQTERSKFEKVLAGLIIAGEHWVGFFPEDKIKEAKESIRSLIQAEKNNKNKVSSAMQEVYDNGWVDALDRVLEMLT